MTSLPRSFRISRNPGNWLKLRAGQMGAPIRSQIFVIFAFFVVNRSYPLVAASLRAVLCVRYSYPIADTIGSDAACFAGPKLARTQRVTEAKIESTATSYG